MEQIVATIENLLLEEISAISIGKLFSAVLIACAAGVLIAIVYRVTYGGVLFNKQFLLGLILMSMITSTIILAISSNLVLSLGMVGALSIVRFRNVVKDPYDLLYLFWAISTGIICGTQLFKIAFLLAAVVTVLLLFLEFVTMPKAPALLIVNSADPALEAALLSLVSRYSKKYRVKSRTLQPGGLDIIVEVRPLNEAEMIAECGKLPGVTSVTLLAHDGELRG